MKRDAITEQRMIWINFFWLWKFALQVRDAKWRLCNRVLLRFYLPLLLG
jgi:hypothetical protein